MPLSRKRNRVRMKRRRVREALLGSTAVLRKRLWDMKLALDAKTARVEWQSSGILGLHDKIATLEALLATQPAMQENAIQERILRLETDLVLREAMEDKTGLET